MSLNGEADTELEREEQNSLLLPHTPFPLPVPPSSLLTTVVFYTTRSLGWLTSVKTPKHARTYTRRNSTCCCQAPAFPSTCVVGFRGRRSRGLLPKPPRCM